ncbi:ATP-binding protein, partial [Mycobacterium avium]
HKTTVDQFTHPTTTKKWSRFVPFTSSMVGNSTGILLGFNRNNALNSAVLLDLPAAARRNRNPCLVCSGALGYGKSYAAKRITRGEIQRGAQAFIVDPGTEWQKALADVDNKAVIDMAGNHFSCDPLRTFPADVAGGYWLDYMVPMMSLDPRSIGVRRLRTILHPDARQRLGITSTAALMTYISNIQAPAAGPDTRPPQVAQLADDLAPIGAALQSWATYDFTQAIFDDTLAVPDLARLDVTIWLTGSLDLPTAEEMNTPHLYERLSDRKRASVAIYGMLVRLARVTFFADSSRFGLIVVEEAAALLNSRAGADDAHLISRRARKHYTGLLIITQDPIRDLALMGDQFITQQLIMPFENEDLARQVAAKVGIRLDDYPDIEEFFLAQPSPEEMRDPTAFDDIHTAAGSNRGARQGYGFFVDEFRRKSPIWVASEPDRAVHDSYDTTPGRAA